MPALKNAATKNFSISFSEYDGTILISMSGSYSVNVPKSEAKALIRILQSMTDTDD